MLKKAPAHHCIFINGTLSQPPAPTSAKFEQVCMSTKGSGNSYMLETDSHCTAHTHTHIHVGQFEKEEFD